MKLAYDLHIHSALSPCGDRDMTPNNIINMSLLKGLDIISVTDHNTMLNNIPVFEIGRKKGLLVIPGIEVTTKEEVHVLCYFNNINDGIKFSNIIYDSLPDIKNNNNIFGNQIIFNVKDEESGSLDKLLLNSTKYTLEEVYDLTKELRGIMIPAHINKKSYSILSVLGFIPNNISLKSLEIWSNSKSYKCDKLNSYKEYNLLRNSDAHYLGDISERKNFIEIESNSISGVLKYLEKGRNKH